MLTLISIKPERASHNGSSTRHGEDAGTLDIGELARLCDCMMGRLAFSQLVNICTDDGELAKLRTGLLSLVAMYRDGPAAL